MAKQTEDRENLLRDGIAMPVRGRLFLEDSEIVIGFRPDGQLSLYWDQDPVYQFDASQRLRRVFLDSNRFKVEKGRLFRLAKTAQGNDATTSRLRLVSEPISESEETLILQKLTDRLQQINDALTKTCLTTGEQQLQTVGLTDQEFRTRVRKWISRLDQPIRLADGPSA